MANQDSDTISVIDLAAFNKWKDIPVGRDPVDIDGPTSLLLDPTRDILYVLLTYAESLSGVHAADFATRRAGYVQVLAREDLLPLANFRLEPAPFALALSPSRDTLAATHFDTVLASVTEDPLERRASLAIFDRSANALPIHHPLCIAPAGLAFLSDQVAAIACVGTDTVAMWDQATSAIKRELDIDPSSPQKPVSLSLSADRSRLAVSFEVSRQVGVLDPADFSLLQVASVPGVPQDAHFLSPSRLLVPLVDPDALVELNLETGEVVDSLALDRDECQSPNSITALGERTFLVCQGNHFDPGTLLEIGVQPLVVQGRLELGLYPDRMVVDER